MKRSTAPIVLSALVFGLCGFLTREALLAQAPSPDALEKLVVYPTLIVYNGKIATMDNSLTTYQAMAIRGDRIWTLGTDKEIRELAGPQTQMIDVKGRTVVPGLIDAHTHLHLWAWWHYGDTGLTIPELEPAYIPGKNLEEVKMNLKPVIQQRIKEKGKDKWVIAAVPFRMASGSNGLQRFYVGGALHGQPVPPSKDLPRITRAELDSIAPDTPVMVVSGLSAFVNSKGREVMIEKNGYETPTSVRQIYDIVWGAILKGRTAEAVDLFTREAQDTVNHGVTTFASHAENNTEFWKAVAMLDRQGKMPIRFAWSHESGFYGFHRTEDAAQFYRLLGDLLGTGNDFLWNIGVGSEAWDGDYRGNCLSEIGRTKEIQQQTISQLYFSIFPDCIATDSFQFQTHLAAVEAGHRLYAHASIGDKVMDRFVALADQAIQNKTRTLEDIRQQGWMLDHNKLIRPDQIPLIKKYGFMLNFQALYFVRELWRARNYYKPEVVSWVTPLKSLLDAGIRFSITTDVTISKASDNSENYFNSQEDMFPYRDSIWPHIGVWLAPDTEVSLEEYRNGTRPKQIILLDPVQRIDRTSALRAMTTWAAEQLLRGDRLGSLEPGKLADFVVIDKDYFTISEREINNIKTLMTVLGGKIAYKAVNF